MSDSRLAIRKPIFAPTVVHDRNDTLAADLISNRDTTDRRAHMRMTDKVAIVVGAGRTPGWTIGNGRATAILFARDPQGLSTGRSSGTR